MEADIKELTIKVAKLEESSQYICRSMDELRAEVRFLSDLVSACALPQLCHEHEERGKEFETMKRTVDRHDVTLSNLSKISWLTIGTALTAIFTAIFTYKKIP